MKKISALALALVMTVSGNIFAAEEAGGAAGSGGSAAGGASAGAAGGAGAAGAAIGGVAVSTIAVAAVAVAAVASVANNNKNSAVMSGTGTNAVCVSNC